MLIHEKTLPPSAGHRLEGRALGEPPADFQDLAPLALLHQLPVGDDVVGQQHRAGAARDPDVVGATTMARQPDADGARPAPGSARRRRWCRATRRSPSAGSARAPARRRSRRGSTGAAPAGSPSTIAVWLPVAIRKQPKRPRRPAPSVTWFGVIGQWQRKRRVIRNETFLLMWRATRPRSPRSRSSKIASSAATAARLVDDAQAAVVVVGAHAHDVGAQGDRLAELGFEADEARRQLAVVRDLPDLDGRREPLRQRDRAVGGDHHARDLLPRELPQRPIDDAQAADLKNRARGLFPGGAQQDDRRWRRGLAHVPRTMAATGRGAQGEKAGGSRRSSTAASSAGARVRLRRVARKTWGVALSTTTSARAAG